MKILDCPIELEVIKGEKFIKELIYEGSYIHPDNEDERVDVTIEKMQEWVNNFAKKLVDIPFVPLKHTDDPEKNTGEVTRLWIADSPSHPGKKSLFAELTIKIKEIAEKIGKTIKGCSVGIVGVTSPETGEYLGEAVEHVALTNRPYVPNLADYQSVGFSKNPIFVFEKVTKLKKEDKHMEATEFEKKLDEMKKANDEMVKNLTVKFDMEKKENEKKSAEKVAELEKKAFESEVSNAINLLEAEGKITPAEKPVKLEFAKKLNKELFAEYVAELQKSEKKVKTDTQLSKQDSKEGGKELPLVSDIAEWGKLAFSGKITKTEFQRRLIEWGKKYKAAGENFDKKGSQIVNLENPRQHYIGL